MEISFGIIVLALVALYVFKRPVKTVTGFINDSLITEVNEGQVELTQRSMAAYEELIETCGEDYKTPREIWEKMHKRQRKTPMQQGSY